MIKAIEELELNDDLIAKFNKSRSNADKIKDIDELIDIIENQFDEIFKLEK